MPVVGPIKDTRVLVVYDTDSAGFGGPLDMNGPAVGNLAYAQPGGNLALRISIEFGQPNTKYQVFLVCGPAHSAACGFITIGVLVTNAVGAGAGGFNIPAPVLEAAPFGPGFRNDHVDLLGSDPRRSSLTAGAINYFVCKRVSAGSTKAIPKGMATATPGDPAAAKQSKAKAKGKRR
jgi:hypothetical protein